MNFKKLFHATTSKMESQKAPIPAPEPQKLFYRPGTIEEQEEDQELYDEPKFKIENECPLLYRNHKNHLFPSAPNLQRIHTSSSLTRLSAAPSLARISTANSSLYQVPGTIRHDSSR